MQYFIFTIQIWRTYFIIQKLGALPAQRMVYTHFPLILLKNVAKSTADPQVGWKSQWRFKYFSAFKSCHDAIGNSGGWALPQGFCQGTSPRTMKQVLGSNAITIALRTFCPLSEHFFCLFLTCFPWEQISWSAVGQNESCFICSHVFLLFVTEQRELKKTCHFNWLGLPKILSSDQYGKFCCLFWNTSQSQSNCCD